MIVQEQGVFAVSFEKEKMADEKKHSAAWDRFYKSFFGDPYMAWHDGLDTKSLGALKGEEREEAERLLNEALKTGDYRPAVGLRVLGAKGSVARLKEQLHDAEGKTEVEIALALWKLAEWPPAVNILIRALKDRAALEHKDRCGHGAGRGGDAEKRAGVIERPERPGRPGAQPLRRVADRDAGIAREGQRYWELRSGD